MEEKKVKCIVCGREFAVKPMSRRKMCSSIRQKERKKQLGQEAGAIRNQVIVEGNAYKRKKPAKRVSTLDARLKRARELGITFAQLQMQETLEMVGRVRP